MSTLNEDQSPVSLKNWLMFITASLGTLILWQVLFPPQLPPPAPPAGGAVESTTTGGDPTTPASTIAAAPDPVTPTPAALPATAASEIARRRVTTPHGQVELTNRGGRVTSWTLNEPGYRQPDLPLELVPRAQSLGVEGAASISVSDDAPMLPLQVITGDPNLDGRLASALHEVEIEEGDGTTTAVMSWSDGAGTSVRKELVFDHELPVVTVTAQLTSAGRPRDFHLAWGPGFGDHSPEEAGNMYFERGRLTYRTAGEVEQVQRPDKAGDLLGASVTWAGLEDSYFVALFVPQVPRQPSTFGLSQGFRLTGELPVDAEGKRANKRDWPKHVVLEVPFSVSSPSQGLIVAPRSRELLERIDQEAFGNARQLVSLTDLGTILGPIARMMHSGLVTFHGWLGNWGLAIILLTIVIRGIMFPLTHFSMVKTRRMQQGMGRIKPQLDKLKAKYKKLPRSMETRQQEQQEMMALYRGAGINPADQVLGCLPILLSLPFFWALFRLLQGASEFRYQGFLFWDDLSAQDPTHVWPLLTGLSTFVLQKMTMSQASASMTPEMESVQRNMLFLFPAMFVFFCWSAPLGLVVYWTASNVFSLGQQYLLNKILPPVEPVQGSSPKRREAKKPKDSKEPALAVAGAGEESPAPESRRKRRKKR